jgi:hypothetical protein
MMSEIAAMRRKPSLHPVPMMLPEFGGQNGPDPEGSLCFLTRLPFGNADVIGTLKVEPKLRARAKAVLQAQGGVADDATDVHG